MPCMSRNRATEIAKEKVRAAIMAVLFSWREDYGFKGFKY